MRAILVAARAALAALVSLLSLSLVAAEFKLPAPDATPAELVKAALQSELEGPSDVRKTLLDRALELDAELRAARWQSGYVKYDDQWLTLDEVARRAADDKRLAEYRKRRDAAVDRAEDHRELARWCKKNALVEEARVHWAKVLEFNPADAEALSALGLQLYEGQLLTKQQITEAKKQAGERLQAMKRWQPQMVKWRKAIENLKGHDYDFALHEMRKLEDVEALPALEATLAENVASPKADALNLALIETAGRIQSPEATQVLLRRAIQPDSEAVRVAACDQLKKRPLYACVPQLIASMPVPPTWNVSYRVSFASGNTIVLDAEINCRNDKGERAVSFTMPVSTGVTIWSRMRPELRGRQFADLPGAVNAISNAVQGLQTEAAALARREHQARLLQSRLVLALEQITDREMKNPEDWHSWWNDRSESYVPSYDPTNSHRRESYNYVDVRQAYRVVTISCFPAGTNVLTISGKCPIDSLQPGDRVICENPTTGELVAKPVQGTTLRPAAPLVKLALGSQTLSATRGHPFWVNGQGWTMAKHLKVGQILHGVDGAVRIDAIEEAPAREAYNLVVGDYGTYFVGETPVLVHDNTPITETNAVVPGLELAATP